jgi:hypothetical protein
MAAYIAKCGHCHRKHLPGCIINWLASSYHKRNQILCLFRIQEIPFVIIHRKMYFVALENIINTQHLDMLEDFDTRIYYLAHG